MKILIVSPWYKPHIGGVVETITKLIGGLNRAGIKTAIFLNGDSESIQNDSQDNETQIYSCRLRSPQAGQSQLRVFVAWLIMFLPTLIRLRSFIKKQQIDIVNIHYPGAEYFYFVILRLLLPIKIVVSIHGSDMRITYPLHGFNKLLTRQLLRRADALVACSEDMRQYASDLIGGKSYGRSEVIYGGVEPASFDQKNITNAESLQPYLIAVGTLRPVKGFDLLIHAFDQIKNINPNLKLRIVGEGTSRAELEQLTKELKLTDRICFEGSLTHEALIPIYQQASFCVIPSRNEALSLVALEAQASGLTVVASKIGGLPEIIEHNVNGLLVSAEDIAALSQAMTELLNNPERCHKMGQAGRQLIDRNFRWELNHQKYLKLFSELAS